jgi:hypothetical protein
VGEKYVRPTMARVVGIVREQNPVELMTQVAELMERISEIGEVQLVEYFEETKDGAR